MSSSSNQDQRKSDPALDARVEGVISDLLDTLSDASVSEGTAGAIEIALASTALAVRLHMACTESIDDAEETLKSMSSEFFRQARVQAGGGTA